MWRFSRACSAKACGARSFMQSTRPCLSEKLLIGNPENGTIPAVSVSWTDIAGFDTALSHRLAAGRVLYMMDMCAARTANKVSAEVTKRTGQPLLTSTVGVTNTVFSSAILHGDAIRMEGKIVHCGGSALGVYIRFFRQSPTTRMETAAGESFFTMVTMTPDLKAAKVVPAMELTDPGAIEMHHRYQYIRSVQQENEAHWKKIERETLSPEQVDCPINIAKGSHVTITSTQCEAQRIFFSAYLNNNNTVFGGELMSWMESHATFCGRMFTGNRYVYTIGMHSVAFNAPVYATDWVTLQATVTYVRNTTMEVDVRITAERKGGGETITNRAAFVLINEDDIGHKTNIPIGLDLEHASQDELHAYMEAKWRYHKSVERRVDFEKTVHPRSLAPQPYQ